MFSWLRRRRRKRLLEEPFPASWSEWIERLPFTRTLSEEEQRRLRGLVRVFVAEKRWEGCGGFELTDEVRVVVAAQACLLILELDHDWYQRVSTILVYPSAYRTQGTRTERGGIVTGGEFSRSGEAWGRNDPVVLSWDHAFHGGSDPSDGRNLVFHEFAHKLDWLDGYADGTPPLSSREQAEAWRRITTREYERLTEMAEGETPTLLDKYGATNPAEFFAVATECFFERPGPMREAHPELYDLLRTFYRQDPAERASGAREGVG